MREIKFRAWDKGKMRRVDSASFNKGKIRSMFQHDGFKYGADGCYL